MSECQRADNPPDCPRRTRKWDIIRNQPLAMLFWADIRCSHCATVAIGLYDELSSDEPWHCNIKMPAPRPGEYEELSGISALHLIKHSRAEHITEPAPHDPSASATWTRHLLNTRSR